MTDENQAQNTAPQTDEAAEKEEKQENPAPQAEGETADKEAVPQEQQNNGDNNKESEPAESVKNEDTAEQAAEAESTEKPLEEVREDYFNNPEIRPGATVRIYQKIKEKTPKGEDKERIQVFEGMILARKNKYPHTTITVRKVSEGIGVEKIFPLALPAIDKIEVTKQAKVRQSKLYFLRNFKKRLKEIKK